MIQREGDAVLLPVLLFPEKLENGKRLICRKMELSVAFSRSFAPVPSDGHYVPGMLTRHAVNAVDQLKWYAPWGRATQYDFLVIAREQFAQTSKNLQPFIDFKKGQGFNPLLVTLEQIEEEEGDMGAAQRTEKLRGWLKANYKALGFRFVVLLGAPGPDDPDGIPMKRCYPMLGYEEESELESGDVPTDLYYADLTGNWNPDGDEHWCELEDYVEIPEETPEEGDAQPGRAPLDGVDLVPEILVGRIPHYGKLPFYADSTLERIMAYEKKKGEGWHNRVLLPAPMITFPDGHFVDGSLVAKYLIEQSLDGSGVGHAVLAEEEGNLKGEYPGPEPLEEFTFVQYWNQGFGAVMWCAHGSQEVAVRDIWNDDVNGDGKPQQEETKEPHFVNVLFHKIASGERPPVVFQGSCLNSDPDYPGNLAHTLLQHVSIANVASTRITTGLEPMGASWTPSPFSPGAFTLGLYFTSSIMTDRKTLGEAFHYAQAAMALGYLPGTLKVRLEFNLYGDPSLAVPGCQTDADCSDGDLCNGEEVCEESKCHAGTPLVCTLPDSAQQCREYGCLPDSGCGWADLPDYSPCEDGDPCTDPDLCKGGECYVTPRVCPPGGPCAVASCDASAGGCVNAPLPDGTSCEAGGGSGICLDGKCSMFEPDLPAVDLTEKQESDAISSDSTGAPSGHSRSEGCGTSSSPSGSAVVLVLSALAGLALLQVLRKLLYAYL